MTRDLLLYGLGVLCGLLVSTAISRPWRARGRTLAETLTSPITPGPRPAGRTVPCPDCVAGIAVWTGSPGSRTAVECGTCDGTAVVSARSRMWLVPGARVVDRDGAVGTVLDPIAAYAVLGTRMPLSPLDTGRWPVRFDVDPATVRWTDAADLDPITPADEELLSKIAARAPSLRPLRPVPPPQKWL